MTKGRKRIPTAIKILSGNPGRRPLPESEPTSAPGLPKPPKHITGELRKAWFTLAKQLDAANIPTHLDGMAFELLVQSYASYIASCKKVAEAGPIWLEKGDGKIPKFAYSPYWSVMNREWEKVKAMLTEFGMTPSSRSKVQATATKQEADPLLDMLKKRQSSN